MRRYRKQVGAENLVLLEIKTATQKQKQKSKFWQNSKFCQKPKNLLCRSRNQNHAQKQKRKSKFWQNSKFCQKSKLCRSRNQNYAEAEAEIQTIKPKV